MSSATTRSPETQPALRRTLATWAAVSLSVAAMGASLAINLTRRAPGPLSPRRSADLRRRHRRGTAGRVRLRPDLRPAQPCRLRVRPDQRDGRTPGRGGCRLGAARRVPVVHHHHRITAGIFGADFLRVLGLWHTTPGIAPWIIALVAVAISLVLGIAPIPDLDEDVAVVEISTTALILLIAVS